MIDPLAASSLSTTSPSPTAVGMFFIAGALTSFGPCVAPRYIAIAAIANGYRRPIVPTLAFVGGLVSAFVLLGFGAGLLGSLWSSSSLVYATLAAALLIGGAMTLVRAVSHDDCPAAGTCAGNHNEQRHPAAAASRSLGGVFLLGAASAFVISPCCTPVIASVIATTAAVGKPVLGLIFLTSFALGHALPLIFAGSIASLVQRARYWRGAAQAPAIVAGSLMMTLGAYYGVLA